MKRRGFLGSLLAGAAATIGVGMMVPSVVKAEESDGCAECARLFDGEVVLPAMYTKPAPEIMETARQAVHAMTLRDWISHDEAALIVYWQAFPTYAVVSNDGHR